jgi:hypothetical protein
VISTKDGARRARRRTRAVISIAVAVGAAAAVAGPASAAVTASANDPNTTLPASFTDSADGLSVGLCADGTLNCSSIPPVADAPVSTANFDPSGEAFWMLANASFSGPLAGSVAEFALEAAFLGDIAPNQGSTFSRIRFRFDLPAGRYRITHPYGVNTYDVTGSGSRTINDTVDTGCLANPCDPTTVGYGPVTSILRWDSGAPNGYIGDAATPHKVTGSPTGVNSVTVERRTAPPSDVNPVGLWETVDSTDKFTVEGKIAGSVPAPAPFVGVDTTRVVFAGRRSDETSSTKRVTVTNTGAAPLTIASVTIGGPDASEFTRAGSCVGRTDSLAPGAKCDVIVGFTGSGAVGDRSATLTVASDAANTHALAVDLAAAITGLSTPPSQAPVMAPAGVDRATIIQIIQPSTQQVLGAKVTSPVAVSGLTLARRISIARVQVQGLRASMRVKEGTNVVRIAIYKARDGKKTGSALYVTNRAARAGLLRVTLRSRGLLAKLRAGTYVMEVRSGQSLGSLAATRRIAFTVAP